MTRVRATLGSLVRGHVPEAVTSRVPPRIKARLRSILGIEPWPDLAVRHPLFRSRDFREIRQAARVFDVPKPTKPILERGHQASFLLARWLAAAGVRSAFQIGYADGRYLFYLTRTGIMCGGTDLPEDETAWVRVPDPGLDEATRRRLLRVDFFELTPADIRSAMGIPVDGAVDVLFSEATFETMLPWRSGGASVPGYLALGTATLRALMHERFPAKLGELGACARNMIFIEPEPAAGGAGVVFSECARRLPGWTSGVWEFRSPFDRLLRLSPRFPTRQTVYAFTRDGRLLDALRPYAVPM